MLCKTYMSDGKEYKFILTLKSKIELEKFRQDLAVSSTSSFATMTKEEREKLSRLRELRDGEEVTEEMQTLTMELAPVLNKIQSSRFNDDEINLQIAWILFKNYKENKDRSREDFDSLIETMEEEQGIEFVCNFLKEIKDKVFTFLDSLQK